MVSWRDQPTRYDIEAVQENTRRVGLVIRMRWALLIVLVTYSLVAGGAYAANMKPGELIARMLIPALALGLVVVYNTFYQLNYKRLGNIAVWNNLQLALDAIVVTVLVYFSGGVTSWFWSMYSLFILEAAFILPRRRAVWALAGVCMLLLGMVEWLDLLHVLPHVTMPFAENDSFDDVVYVAVRYGWQIAVIAGTAAVSTQLVGELRAEAASRQSLVVRDAATGLYSRAYFLRGLNAEIRRAQRDVRPLHVLLLDIDRFGEFNRRFGIERGDALLRKIADAITATVGEAGDVLVTTNLAARFGGEEFVVLLAEDAEAAGPPQEGDAFRLGDRLRQVIACTTVEGAGVTVSVGIASYPVDGSTGDHLLDAADAALSAAIESGGDTVEHAARSEEADDEHGPRAYENDDDEDDEDGVDLDSGLGDGISASDLRDLAGE